MDGEAHLKLLKAHSLDSQLTQKLEKIYEDYGPHLPQVSADRLRFG